MYSASGQLPGTTCSTITPPVCVLFLWEVYVIADIHTLALFSSRTMTDMLTFQVVNEQQEEEEEEEAEGKSLSDIWKSMSNPDFSQFRLYTSSLIGIHANAWRVGISLLSRKKKRESKHEKIIEHSQQKRPPIFFLNTSNTRHASQSCLFPDKHCQKDIQEVGLLCEGFDLRQSVETNYDLLSTDSHTQSHTHGVTH